MDTRVATAISGFVNRGEIASDGTVEIEVRFGDFGAFPGTAFTPGISAAAFSRMRTHLERGGRRLREIHRKVTVGADGTRLIQQTVPPVEDVWQAKTSLVGARDDIREFGLRVGYSIERPLGGKPPNFRATFIREQRRFELEAVDAGYIVMLTRVTERAPNAPRATTRFELEIELVNPGMQGNSAEEIGRLVLEYYRIVHDTRIAYSLEQKFKALAEANRILGGSKPHVESARVGLDPHTIVQPRNLRRNDLVWGGLIGAADRTRFRYKVTHKTDGLRKLLFINESGIWLLSPPYEANLVYQKTLPAYVGTILDGELVTREQRRFRNPTPAERRTLATEGGLALAGAPDDARHLPPEADADLLYVVFDCIASSVEGRKGEDYRAVQALPHTQRMARAQTIKNAIMDQFPNAREMAVMTKIFREIGRDAGRAIDFAANRRAVEQFFTVMRQMFDEIEHLAYAQDGFIFLSEEAPYRPATAKGERVENLPLDQRKLTRVPDVCKWKPPDCLTIDLLARRRPSDGAIELLAGAERPGGTAKLFQGVPGTPPVRIDMDAEQLRTLDLPAVFEFRWDPKRGFLTPVRERVDKIAPNRWDFAADTWQLIFRPVLGETLRGQDFELVRQYHGDIKTTLLANLPRGATLLDLGAGVGADVMRWRNRGFSRVVAVEPNAKNARQLRQRITDTGMTDIVRVVDAGAREATVINTAVLEFVGERVDAVALMNSLPTIVDSEGGFEHAAETIRMVLKPGGAVLIITPDGDAIRQLFAPQFGPLSSSRFEFGNIPGAFIALEGDRFTFSIPDHRLVRRQTEPLVLLDDLLAALPGFKDELWQRADKQHLMPEAGRILSQLYSYGVLRAPTATDLVRLEDLPELEPPPLEAEVPQPLRPLPVRAPSVPTQPAIGDDVVSDLYAPWFPNLVRIATLAEGSGFMHAFLKAVMPAYQTNATYAYRTGFAQDLRRDLAALLARPRQNDPNTTVGDFTADILMARGAPAQPLAEMQGELNSTRDIAPRWFQYIADVFMVDVIVLAATSTGLSVSSATIRTFQEGQREGFPEVIDVLRRVVIMVGEGGYFETVGLRTPEGIATVFSPADDLVLECRRRLGLDQFIAAAQSDLDAADDLPTSPETADILGEYLDNLRQYLDEAQDIRRFAAQRKPPQ